MPNYNPRDIVANLRRLMAEEPQQPMHPWYRGYTGQVVPTERGSYQSYGTLSELDTPNPTPNPNPTPTPKQAR